MKQLLLPLLFFPAFLFAQFAPPLSIHEGFETFSRATMADVDQDGDMEVFSFVNEELRYLKAYQGDMQRYFLHQKLDFASTNPSAIRSYDLDLDADLDLLLFNDGALYWIPYDAGQDMLLAPVELAQIATEDPSHALDIQLTPGAAIEMISAQSDSVFQLLITPEIGGPTVLVNALTTLPTGIERMGLGDVDGDNNADLLFWDESDIRWAPQTSLSPLEFGPAVLVQAAVPHVKTLTTAFMDSNSAPDIVTTLGGFLPEHNLVYWYKNLDGLGTTWSNPKDLVSAVGRLNGSTFIDLDQDGDQDLLLNDRYAGPCWSENINDEYQTPARLVTPIDQNEEYYGSIQLVADLDNDGAPDFLHYRDLDDAHSLRWYRNDIANSGKILPSPLIMHNLSFLYQTDFADFDQDGDIDIVAAYGRRHDGNKPYDEMLVVYEYLSDIDKYTIHTSNRFYPVSNGNDPVYRACAYFLDADEDGDMDILYQINWQTEWLENLDGVGTFSSPHQLSQSFPSGNSVYGIFLDDLNNDGLQDIIKQDIILLNEPNSGAFSIIDTDPDDDHYKWVQTIDFDGDGDKDLLLARNLTVDGVRVAWNLDGTGTNWDIQHLPAPNLYTTLYNRVFNTFDYDQDGDEDILYTDIDDFTNVYWFENFGGSSFAETPNAIANHIIPENSEAGEYGVQNTYFADFDGDGWTDFITGSNGNNLQTLYFNIPGQAVLEYPIQLLPDRALNTIDIQDMDNDGDPDVIASDYSRMGDLIWIGNELDQVPVDQGHIIQYLVYLDTDENQQFDSSDDPVFPNTAVHLVDQNMIGFTNSTGFGIFEVEDPGEYTLEVDIPANFEPTTPASVDIHTDTLDTQQYISFGVFSDSLIHEGTTTYYHGFERCNDTVIHTFKAINRGNGPIDMWIGVSYQYNLSGPLAPPIFDPSNPPDSISGNSYLWFIENVNPVHYGSSSLWLPLPAFIPDTAQIFTWTYDVWYFDELEELVWTEQNSFEYEMFCGYDPNDKQVRPFRDSTYNYFVESDEEFEYVVRFQNTGTDTAFTVLITDTLDMNLQWESFYPIDASHLYNAQLDLDAGVVEFLFENIMLPDSNVNEAASHGYVIYRVRPKSNLADSTVIKNTAGIYFDANPPVITNTVFSTYSKCGLLDPNTNMVYFPGPTVLEVDICAGEIFEWMDQNLDTTGIYTIVLQTTEGCDSLIELHLSVHELPMLEEVVIQEANSNGGGSVQPTIAGGTPPYTYLWANGSTEATLENVAAGVYALLITDAIGCSISLEFEVPLNTGTRFPEAQILSLLPNPVKAGASLFMHNPASSDEMSILLYDAFGQSHAVELLQTAAEIIEFKAPGKAGVYWLVAQNLDKQWVQRILVY